MAAARPGDAWALDCQRDLTVEAGFLLEAQVKADDRRIEHNTYRRQQ
jgi:hypothetical protein